MIGEEILNQKPVTLRKIRELLEEKQGDKELTYEQDISLKHAKKFATLKEDKEKKLREELENLGIFKDEEIVKLIDILPDKKEIVQLAVPDHEKDADRIFEILAKYAKKK